MNIDADTSDAALIAAMGRGDPRDRTAAHILHTRHAAALRAAVTGEIGERYRAAADVVVDDVFLGLLFGAATAFQPARDDALPWLEGFARQTASEHVRAGALADLTGASRTRTARTRGPASQCTSV